MVLLWWCYYNYSTFTQKRGSGETKTANDIKRVVAHVKYLQNVILQMNDLMSLFKLIKVNGLYLVNRLIYIALLVLLTTQTSYTA